MRIYNQNTTLRILFCLLFTPVAAVAYENSSCRCCDVNRVYLPYLEELPPPVKRNNIGNSYLKITTSSPEAQIWFNQGLNLLHCFWENEAYRCFAEGLKHDPKAAMLHWGIGMSLSSNNTEGSIKRKLALEKAISLSSKSKASERLYIKSLQALMNKDSKSVYDSMMAILKLNPGDPDAAAFIALWIKDGYDLDGKPKVGTKQAIGILQHYLTKFPDHVGLNHYFIHVLENGPYFLLAKNAAKKLPSLASGAGHILHMPGHIYYREGNFQQAIQSFKSCRKLEEQYLSSARIPAIDLPNYIHNLHFLAITLSEVGQYNEALEIAELLHQLRVTKGRELAAGSYQLYYIASSLKAYLYMKRGDFSRALESLKLGSLLAGSKAEKHLLFLQVYLKAKIKLTTAKKMVNLENELATLERILSEYTTVQEDSFIDSEFTPWKNVGYTLNLFTKEIQAYVNYYNSGEEFTVDHFSEVIGYQKLVGYSEPPFLPWPIEEELGRFLLDNNESSEKSIQLFKKALLIRPRSANAHLGLARAYSLLDNEPLKISHYLHFLNIWQFADKDMSELDEAASFIQSKKVKNTTLFNFSSGYFIAFIVSFTGALLFFVIWMLKRRSKYQ